MSDLPEKISSIKDLEKIIIFYDKHLTLEEKKLEDWFGSLSNQCLTSKVIYKKST